MTVFHNLQGLVAGRDVWADGDEIAGGAGHGEPRQDVDGGHDLAIAPVPHLDASGGGIEGVRRIVVAGWLEVDDQPLPVAVEAHRSDRRARERQLGDGAS